LKELSDGLKLVYDQTEGRILCEIALLDGLYMISFTARGIWRDRHGVYGHIAIRANGRTLSFSQMNLYKDEERVRIVNASHLKMPKTLQVVYPRDNFKADFDSFCEALWDEFIRTSLPKLLKGRPRDLETQFALKPYIINHGGTILFGPPGIGKSYLALAMAIMVNEGLPILWPVTQRRVLFLNLERSEDSIEERIWMLKRALELKSEVGLLTLTSLGKSLFEIRDMVRETIRREGIEMVVLDSISRTGLGTLVEDRTANAIIDMLNSLCPTWLAIAHAPKANSETIYGSVHFIAGASIVVQVASESRDSKLGIGLEVVKANDIARPPTGVISLEFDEEGLTFIGKAKRDEFPELLALKKPTLGDEIESILHEMGTATADEIATLANRSRNRVAAVLNADDRFVRIERKDKRNLWAIATKETP